MSKWMVSISVLLIAVGLQAMSGKPDQEEAPPFQQIEISKSKSSDNPGFQQIEVTKPKKDLGFDQIDALGSHEKPGFDRIAVPRSEKTGRRSKPDNYLDTIPVFWRNLYPNGGNGLYCGAPFKPHDRRVNVEHVFPMSWATKDLRCGDRRQCRATSDRFNRLESDLHNLYPARADLNKARGAFRYGFIKGEKTVEKGCDFEIDYRARVVEPRPAVRGDIARAMLYMEKQHGLTLHKKTKKLMTRWHRDDPPSAEERRRNDAIERVQGNRNPFIDQ